jgi:hypothetical protein
MIPFPPVPVVRQWLAEAEQRLAGAQAKLAALDAELRAPNPG